MSITFVFDFDGVLVDSSRELVVSAYNAAAQSAMRALEMIPSPFQRSFVAHRHLAKNAGEIVTLAKVCLNTDAERIPSELLAQTKLKEKELFAIGKQLFEVRSIFMNSDPDSWSKLNTPFEPLFSAANKLSSKLILTYKNQAAVNKILNYYDFDIKDDEIFSGDKNKSKVENFNEIFTSFKTDEYIFIDDNLNNLLSLQSEFNSKDNLRIFYADWGYGNSDTLALAHKAGLKVLSIDQATAMVNSNIS